ncbi:hypothetical protein ACFSMW_02100 [Virgibacillus halophilus]|uniref:hypothetical protein n=1 Tax=Tigheibacillus halophilus TaxID=361280 RepID=UPI0036359D13
MGIIIVFLVGFGLTVSGGVTVIAYLNFLPAGVSWMEYLLFISTRVECYFLPAGIIIMALAISRFPSNS